MEPKRETHKGGRPRKPKLVRNKGGKLSARLTLEVEGELVRRQVPLGTSDPQVAAKRLERIVKGEKPELFEAQKACFAEHADKFIGESIIRTIAERASRLRRYAYPILGEKAPGDITVDDVYGVLYLASEQLGAWSNTVRNLRNDISAVLGELARRQVIPQNVALLVDFKKKPVERVKLKPIVLTDAEFTAFITYGMTLISRDINCPAGEGCLPELYMLALCARCLGGMRTSDVHAWRWEHIDTRHWEKAVVPRPKTMGGREAMGAGDETTDEGEIIEDTALGETESGHILEPYTLPEGYFVEHLRAWWGEHGMPQTGPVFPVRSGARVGQHKRPRTSYAEALRDALWEARVVRPKQGYAQAAPEDQRALCALQTGIKGKRGPVDFHSFRRAWVSATTSKEAGLSFAESMRLADHSDPGTHAKYRRDENRRVIPAAVLPKVPAPAASTPPKPALSTANAASKPATATNVKLQPEGGFWH